MTYDYSKLNGRITEKFGTKTRFAAAINKAPSTVTQKLVGTVEMSRKDITDWAWALDIKADDIPEYFFAMSLRKTEKAGV